MRANRREASQTAVVMYPATGSYPGLAPEVRLSREAAMKRLPSGLRLSICEGDNIFIGCEAKWAERCADGVGDIGRGHVPVVLFNHARVGVA